MGFCTPLLPSIKDQAIGHMDLLTAIVCYLFVKVKQLVIFVCERWKGYIVPIKYPMHLINKLICLPSIILCNAPIVASRLLFFNNHP